MLWNLFLPTTTSPVLKQFGSKQLLKCGFGLASTLSPLATASNTPYSPSDSSSSERRAARNVDILRQREYGCEFSVDENTIQSCEKEEEEGDKDEKEERKEDTKEEREVTIECNTKKEKVQNEDNEGEKKRS